jgi:tRNA(Arg) A34 adenosine deaminase TadA
MSDPFMEQVIRMAVENVQSGRGGPFAAAVVKEGKILAIGVNQVISNNDPTAHAEIMAIREACRVLGSYQLSGCHIYASCEPCPMCLGAIYWARPERVYFGARASDAAAVGFDDQFIYEQIETPRSERSIPMIETMRESALAALDAWRAKPDKVEY